MQLDSTVHTYGIKILDWVKESEEAEEHHLISFFQIGSMWGEERHQEEAWGDVEQTTHGLVPIPGTPHQNSMQEIQSGPAVISGTATCLRAPRIFNSFISVRSLCSGASEALLKAATARISR